MSTRAAALVAFILLAFVTASAAQGIDGRWDAAVLANGVGVPFRFEIATSGTTVTGSFFEGTRKIPSSSGRFANGRLTLEYDVLNTVLDASFDGRELQGTYGSRANANRMQFVATKYVPAVAATAGRVPQVAGEWVMYRTAQDNSQLDVSWRLPLTQSGADVSGAILKTSGDTGALTGAWRNGRLTLSHFSGERPLLFEATMNGDGTLAITLDRRFTYRAARATQLAGKGIPPPPDLAQFTSMKNPREPFRFSGVDADGKPVASTDARFRGKVVMVTIGGTWCVNCRDEAPFLSSLYSEFHPQGLEIVSLFFENDGDPALARPRIAAFAKRFGVAYPIVFAGTTDQAEMKLAQLRNFSVYPTSIVIGRDGLVRSVHAGFASAATGAQHDQLVREQRALIARLISSR